MTAYKESCMTWNIFCCYDRGRGKELKNTGILIFFFFLPKSEFQILFSQNHVQKVLVSHSSMVNIIAAFSISSLNSI